MPLTTSRSSSPGLPASLPVRAAIAFALLAALACKKEAPKAPPVPEVTVAEVIQRDQKIGGELTATLKGYEDIEIRARVEGYLRSIDYREGAEVRKRQLLFTIDDQPYRAKLAEANADLARAQSALSKADLDVKRYTPLAEQRAISQAELDNAIAAQRSARAQVDAQRAMVEKAALDLGYCRMASPIDGLAGQAQRKVGDLVGKGDPTLLATVSSIDPIRVTVQIPEAMYLKYAKDLPPIDPGAPVKPTAERPGAQLVLGDGSVYPERGYVVLVDRAVDPQTGTLRADLAFKNPNKILRPGLYGKVLFAAETRAGALLVPQRSVVEVQGQFSLVVVNAEGKAETRKAKVGPRVGSLWIIEDGVKPGEKVIVEGVLKVRDGMAVKATLVPADPGASAPGAPGGSAQVVALPNAVPGSAAPVPAAVAPTPAAPAAK